MFMPSRTGLLTTCFVAMSANLVDNNDSVQLTAGVAACHSLMSLLCLKS